MSILVAATAYPPSGVSFGAECAAGYNEYPARYQLVLRPNGLWFIERRNVGPTTPNALDSGQVAPLGATATAELVCVTISVKGGTATNRVVAFVNGTKVADTTDSWDNFPAGGWRPRAIVEAYSTTPASVTLTKFVVRHLSS